MLRLPKNRVILNKQIVMGHIQPKLVNLILLGIRAIAFVLLPVRSLLAGRVRLQSPVKVK